MHEPCLPLLLNLPLVLLPYIIYLHVDATMHALMFLLVVILVIQFDIKNLPSHAHSSSVDND